MIFIKSNEDKPRHVNKSHTGLIGGERLAKRVAKYNPEADRRWAEKNPEHKKYLSHRSRARSFIREVATLDDLYELDGMIKDRIKKLTSKSCEFKQDKDARI